MSGEQEYNESITEEVLDHKESLDPKTMSLLTYGRPSDTCQIVGREFPSGRLGEYVGRISFLVVQSELVFLGTSVLVWRVEPKHRQVHRDTAVCPHDDVWRSGKTML